MSSATPLTDSITALTTYANEVTGGSDTTLSEAVATLASGYGGGIGTLIQTITLSSAIANASEAKTSIIDAVTGIQNGHSYWCLIDNNASTNTDYKGIGIFITQGIAGNQSIIIVRALNGTGSTSSSYLFDVTAGSVVYVYDITG